MAKKGYKVDMQPLKANKIISQLLVERIEGGGGMTYTTFLILSLAYAIVKLEHKINKK